MIRYRDVPRRRGLHNDILSWN